MVSLRLPGVLAGALVFVPLAAPRWGAPRRPRQPGVPSSRPPPQAGCACRARQFGSGAGEGPPTHTVCEPTPQVAKPARVSHHTPGLWEMGPMPAWAFQDAAKPAMERAGCRLIPCVSSATVGSPARLREACRQRSIANAGGRVRRSATARARCGARWSARGRSPVCSPRGSAACGGWDGDAGTPWPRRERPPRGERDRWSCPRAPSVCQPLPGAM